MKISSFLYLNTKILEPFINKIRNDAPTYIEPSREILYKKVTDLNNWYTKLIGLDEVKHYQDRVVNLQEKLLSTQEKRREIGRNLAEIRQRSNQLQEELHKIKRQDNLDKFLNLMKDETELLKLEHEVTYKFQEYDQTERELFTAFTNAIRDSHEKQRAQLEYTKYFGIILSIVGSFLTFCYSTLRKDDLKRYIRESLAKQNNIIGNGGGNGEQELGSVVKVIRGETQKLNNVWDSKLNETRMELYLFEVEQKRQQTLMFYTVGVGILFLITCKLFS